VYSSLAQRNLRQVVGRCLYSRPVPSSAPTLPVGGGHAGSLAMKLLRYSFSANSPRTI
jgi:hypothetical protein